MLGTDVRELMLDKDPIGQRAYDAIAKVGEGDVVSIDFSFPKPGSKQPATKQSLETRIWRSSVRRELLQITVFAGCGRAAPHARHGSQMNSKRHIAA